MKKIIVDRFDSFCFICDACNWDCIWLFTGCVDGKRVNVRYSFQFGVFVGYDSCNRC